MKDTKKKIENQVYEGITIDKVKPYQTYVATLNVKQGDKVVKKVVVFTKTKEGIQKAIGYDENQVIFGLPNKIKISEKNNTIRLATHQDIKDFVKHTNIVSMR